MPEIAIGTVSDFFAKPVVAGITLTALLKVGDTIRIKGAHNDFTQTVASIQIEHNSVDQAQAGDAAGFKVSQKVHEGDKVYLVTK